MARETETDRPKAKGELDVRAAAERKLPPQTRTGAPAPGAWTAAQPNARQTAMDLIDRVFELPFEAQLGVLRTLAPQILACLDTDAREGFMRDLDAEIARAERGERSYDLRPQRPTIH